MAFAVYDLETTGLEPRYHQPVQFAAVRLDDDLHETDAVELIARPQNHILPAPGALVTHGRGIHTILGAPLSHYGLMAAIEAKAISWGPSIWTGYNSIRFDEEFLRHSHYCALRQPYMTQFNGNSRGDVIRLAQLAGLIDPGALFVPIVIGKLTFKLAPLAAANGFSDHDAHDALGDVRATAHLLRVIRARAPATWALFPKLVSKGAVVESLLDADFAVVIQHFGVAIAKPVLPICSNPDYPAEWLAINLTRGPAPLLGMSADEFGAALSVSRSQLCRIKTNAMPLVLSAAHPAAARIVPANVLPDAARHVRRFRNEPEFADRLVEASRIVRRVYPPAEHVEDQLYEGGFFPVRGDESRFADFHTSAPAEKFVIAQSMSDERARHLAARIMFNEWPQDLPPEERYRQDRARIARYQHPNAPWMTVASALADIAKLRSSRTLGASAILDEYEAYLLTLRASDAA
jgi:exodeoxyribonuclease-1